MNKYTFKKKLGIDDLKSEFAFISNSQGDTYCTNDIYEYLLSDGWLSYVFNCPMTKENIIKECNLRKEWNKNYIQKLKDDETFGKEYEIEITITHNNLFDSPSGIVKTFENALESHSFIMLNLNNINNE